MTPRVGVSHFSGGCAICAHRMLRYAASRLDASSAQDVVSETFLVAFPGQYRRIRTHACSPVAA